MSLRRDEWKHKHERVTQLMITHKLDAVILTRRCNFAWYTAGGLNHVSTAGDVGASSLLVTRDRAVCITNAIEAPRIIEEEITGLDIEVRPAAWHDRAELARLWSDALGDRRAACDAPVPGLPETVGLLPPEFDRLRWTMTAGEVDRYRTLGRDVAECLEAASRSVQPGMTEHELAARLAGSLLDRGIRSPVILMAADERIRRYRHPIPTDKKFTGWGMAVGGGERHGLCVSVTRLFSFGPIDDDLRRRHDAVCRVDAGMIGATRPSNTLGGVIAVARQSYADNGFTDEWTRHHQGGSTGYLGREVKATPGDPTPIEPNQVFAWNPSIAGTKSEDTILVGPETNEILTATGNWPTTDYEAGGRTWSRCDILEM